MEWGAITTITILMAVASLCMRWRWPSVSPTLASAGIGGSLCGVMLSILHPPIGLAVSLIVNASLVAGIMDRYFSQSPVPTILGPTFDDSKRESRLQLIDDGRKLVAAFNRQTTHQHLIDFLQCQDEWHALRAQLTPTVSKAIENGRLIVATEGSIKDGKLNYLTAEIDRLEREWDLV